MTDPDDDALTWTFTFNFAGNHYSSDSSYFV